jgi:hypothetical protein
VRGASAPAGIMSRAMSETDPKLTSPSAGPPKHLAATITLVGSILLGQLISGWSVRTTLVASACVVGLAAVIYGVHRIRAELRHRHAVLEREREKLRRERAVVAEALERMKGLELELASLRAQADERWKDTKPVSMEEATRKFVDWAKNAPPGSFGAAIRDGIASPAGSSRRAAAAGRPG